MHIEVEDTIIHAHELLAVHDLRSLPVVGSAGQLEGPLSVDMGGTVRERLTKGVMVDPQGRLLAIRTQTDLLSALRRGHIAEQIALHTARVPSSTPG